MGTGSLREGLLLHAFQLRLHWETIQNRVLACYEEESGEPVSVPGPTQPKSSVIGPVSFLLWSIIGTVA